MDYEIVKVTYSPQEFLEVKQRAALNGFATFGQKKEGGGESTAGINQYLKWAESQLVQTKQARREVVELAVKPLAAAVETLNGLTQEEIDLVTAKIQRRK